MNKNITAGDESSMRVIDEIVFQASLLALHAAIESAANDTGRAGLDVELDSLVEQARPPARDADSPVRPDVRVFE